MPEENGNHLEQFLEDEVGADPLDPILRPHIEAMYPEFEKLDAEYREQQEKLREIQERRGRLEKAMRVLRSGTTPTKIKDSAQKDHHNWKPSTGLRRKVIEALVGAGENGLTVTEGVQATGLSNTAIDKVFRHERGELLRLAGSRGNASLYKAVPDALRLLEQIEQREAKKKESAKSG